MNAVRTGRLIKWEGEAPQEPEAYIHPEQHPQCLEVLDVSMKDGEPPVTVYKREESQMAVTTAGVTLMAQMVRGASVTALNAANAYIGVGDSSTAFSVGQTDLVAATNKARKGMDSGYPSGASNVLTYQSTFTTADANFEWIEWGLFNASSGGTMLGRKVESPSLGTKTNTQSWTFQVTATFTAS